MPTDVDRELNRIGDTLNRVRSRTDVAVSGRNRQHREAEVVRRLGRIAAADGAIIAGAIAFALIVSPLGIMGAMLVGLLLIAATMLFAVLPASAPVNVEKLAEIPLKALPRSTERWLETQRPALPSPVRGLVDSIGVKLETLTPQLATLDENSPAAMEVRKLVGEQLPELVKGYARVPEPLRRVERNGLTPDQQLAQGLQLIDDEIAEMTSQLAQGDVDALATRGRYLQIKYQGEDG
ncbi:hypothetical protein J2W22_000131 [Sphingomonas kyeonggiensis]|uniref:hypothetical protein n=1 Tax=Sphingomonas kyeonggiensis TaxID=1268553 RepID=UPI002782DC91|nr:hypothetical protein [Sphingomonas kyeonggiensis]MDQ0248084.1 hypothetical protein [Sphingomonas kyeonggiensis]